MSMLFPSIGQMPAPSERPHPRGLISMLEQGRWWKTRDAGWMRIKDMRPTHRANAAALLMRQAPTLVERITMAEDAVLMRWLLAGVDVSEFVLDDMEREQDERAKNPQAWMANTKLYRSLTRPRKRDAERFGVPSCD